MELIVALACLLALGIAYGVGYATGHQQARQESGLLPRHGQPGSDYGIRN